jgi:metal-responsive CopG/Arc/MetJ family transcriptional regulator
LCRPPFHGYTKGMKTAVSIPDRVFESAERLARQSKKSRSQLVSDALKEYVARHAAEEVTEAMNRVCDQLETTKDPFRSAAASRALERSEW